MPLFGCIAALYTKQTAKVKHMFVYFYEKRKNFSGLSTKAKKKGAKGRRIGNISTKALPPREEKAIRKRFSADAFSAAGILSSLGFSCRLRFGKLIF